MSCYKIDQLDDCFSKAKSKLDTIVSALYLDLTAPITFPKKRTIQNPSLSIDIEDFIPQDECNYLDLVNHDAVVNRVYVNPKQLNERRNNKKQCANTSEKQKLAKSIKWIFTRY